MSTKRIVGIDLGTTNTCVAHVRNNVPKVVPSDKGRLVLPSEIAINSRGELIVGNVAKDQRIVNPHQTIYGHKRLIGRLFHSPFVQEMRQRFTYEVREGAGGETEVVLGDRAMSLPEVSGLILRHVKTISEQFLGGTVEEAVICVPAYYNENQRAAVKEAGRLAGFDVRRLVNEPTAAAIAYGFNRGFDKRILVFDLGGGTFDVSVLELHGNVFQVIASGGDTFLGGADFDAAIIQFVLQSFLDEHRIDLSEDPVVLQRIASAAEAAKVDLSLLSNVVIQLPYVTEKKGKPLDLNISLSRERLNLLTKDLVDRSIEVCDQVLKEAGIATTDVDEIILVGGQTRMPLVQGTIHQHFGRPARKGIHPDECVALGAALLADSLEQLDAVTLVDAVSLPIGIALPSGAFKVVVPGNSNIPSEHVLEVPAAAAKTGFSLDIFQGEGARVVENEYLGGVKVPAGVAKVIFRLDEECLLHVAHEDAGGARAETTIVTKDAPEALKEAWREEVERRRATVTEQGGAPDDRVGVMASIWKVFGRD